MPECGSTEKNVLHLKKHQFSRSASNRRGDDDCRYVHLFQTRKTKKVFFSQKRNLSFDEEMDRTAVRRHLLKVERKIFSENKKSENILFEGNFSDTLPKLKNPIR